MATILTRILNAAGNFELRFPGVALVLTIFTLSLGGIWTVGTAVHGVYRHHENIKRENTKEIVQAFQEIEEHSIFVLDMDLFEAAHPQLRCSTLQRHWFPTNPVSASQDCTDLDPALRTALNEMTMPAATRATYRELFLGWLLSHAHVDDAVVSAKMTSIDRAARCVERGDCDGKTIIDEIGPKMAETLNELCYIAGSYGVVRKKVTRAAEMLQTHGVVEELLTDDHGRQNIYACELIRPYGELGKQVP